MRILLAQNSLYYPSHGGGDKSNRLLMEALAARGHTAMAVARISEFGDRGRNAYLADLAARGVTPRTLACGVLAFEHEGVAVHVVTNANLRSHFESQIDVFRPDVILVSTDDPAQVLLEAALGREAPVVYLARATLALPFGPDCAFPSELKTSRIREVDQVVGVSQYVADYVRRHGGMDAVHVPISLLEKGGGGAKPVTPLAAGSYITMVNPCAVKGIAIFLALADSFPQTGFAAVPTWGTTAEDRAALHSRPNVRLLDPVDDIALLLRQTRVLLVPSLWAEARSRIVLEAMMHGVPVMASNTGGLPEAKMGVPYVLPVTPIARYETRLDGQMVPVADVPPQNIGPWREALERLLTEPRHYEEISLASREAAAAYAANLSAEPFEKLLVEVTRRPKRTTPPGASRRQGLSPEKKRLLALRLRKRAPASAWFPNADTVAGRRLFWFPHAGGGASQVPAVAGCCPVRLPGRETRLPEAPFERMGPLVEALAGAIEPYLTHPFAFFGHSMGAAIAFELSRLLRKRGQPTPGILIASAARAPQYRRNHVPAAPPDDAQLLEELRHLDGISSELLEDAAVRHAILPALRADAALYRNYVYHEEAPLEFPVRAYGGKDDPNVRLEHLEGWAQQTSSQFAVRQFAGGHFYLQSSRAEFLAALAKDLEEAW
jgi:surfactin synthase thioesterase subunit/glycosyltransferase involved in cell wall biosynthesis